MVQFDPATMDTHILEALGAVMESRLQNNYVVCVN
jgi:hypothetical protein